MAWTAPPTYTTGQIITAEDLNTDLRDNMGLTLPGIVTTKGDLGAATAANATSRLAAGANDTVLVADSAQGTGLKWETVTAQSRAGTPNWLSEPVSIEGTSSWLARDGHAGARIVDPGGGNNVYGESQVPRDFVSLTAAYLAVIVNNTGTIDWTVASVQAVAGEDANGDTDTTTADAAAVTAGVITEIDVTAAFNGLTLAALDYLGWRLIIDAEDTVTYTHVLGVRYHYA